MTTSLMEPEELTVAWLKGVLAFGVRALRKSVHRLPPDLLRIVTNGSVTCRVTLKNRDLRVGDGDLSTGRLLFAATSIAIVWFLGKYTRSRTAAATRAAITIA
jgi:hypothetical protein